MKYFVKNNNLIFFVCIIAFLVLIRFIYLSSDTVAIKSLHNQDEGNYSINVRNYIVEGKFIVDQTNFFLLTPVFSFLQIPFVKIFGVHFWSFRIINSITSLLTLFLGYKFLKKEVSKRTAVYYLLLLGLNFIYLIHNRIAMPETTQGLFFLLSIIIFYYAVKSKNFPMFTLSGIVSALTILTKTSASIVVVITFFYFVYSFVYQIKSEKNLRASLKQYLISGLLYFLGLITPLLTWYYLLIKPNYNYFLIVKRNLIDMHRPYVRSALLNHNFWQREIPEFLKGGEAYLWLYFPLLSLMFLCFVFLIIKTKKIKDYEMLFLIWVLVGLGYFLVIDYKPARFYVVNLIPLTLIAAITLSKINRKIGTVILVIYIIFNLTLITKFILYQPNYSLKTASNSLETTMKESTVVGGNLLHLDNSKTKVRNIYFLEGEYSHRELEKYLQDLGYPEYLLIGNNILPIVEKIEYYKKQQYITTNTYFIKPRLAYIYKYQRE